MELKLSPGPPPDTPPAQQTIAHPRCSTSELRRLGGRAPAHLCDTARSIARRSRWPLAQTAECKKPGHGAGPASPRTSRASRRLASGSSCTLAPAPDLIDNSHHAVRSRSDGRQAARRAARHPGTADASRAPVAVMLIAAVHRRVAQRADPPMMNRIQRPYLPHSPRRCSHYFASATGGPERAGEPIRPPPHDELRRVSASSPGREEE